jgi:hypothetical protein
MGKLNVKINKAALATAKEQHANGDDFSNITLEPGRYNGWVKALRAVDTKNGKQIVIDIQVPEANDGRGGKIALFYSLEEDRLVWLLRVLTTLGYDVEAFDGDMLDEIAEDLEKNNPVVRIKASVKGDNTNYRVEQLLEGQTKADISTNSESEDAKDSTNAKGAKGMSDSAPAGAKKASKAKAKTEPEPEPEVEEESVEEETVEEEAVEEPEPSSDEVEIKVGSKCKATIQGVVVPVTIEAIDEDAGKVKARNGKDKKLYSISVEKLIID